MITDVLNTKRNGVTQFGTGPFLFLFHVVSNFSTNHVSNSTAHFLHRVRLVTIGIERSMTDEEISNFSVEKKDTRKARVIVTSRTEIGYKHSKQK